ncbi:MAG TPA: protein kinase [Vicinamibacterales bacterium]
MTLSGGTRLGPYEITGALGAGGMGEVYRARDTHLDRDVALKVLPPELERDRAALTRLAREARLLASLDHPNVGAIYGWEESSGIHAIVLELVEGPTLCDRIAAGPLGLDEALTIARQIADALDAAHERGIIHRDLKPANIKIRPDGRVKVLDFGLAKALTPDAPAHEAATATGATEAGLIVGTPAYMSPEQARGEPVTRSADVWAFGVVIFEMLTGRRPFAGASTHDTLAGILRETPDWEALPRKTPPPLLRLLQRCLEKDPRTRLRDIGDARLDIEEARGSLSGASSGARRAAAEVAGDRRRPRAWGLAAGALVLVFVAAAVTGAYLLGRSRPTTASTEARLALVPPRGQQFASSAAVSPDGRSIAFVAQHGDGTERMLWLRQLSSPEARELPGTNDADNPFWSPDGTTIAFFAKGEGKLMRLRAIGDDPPVVICDAPSARGGTWLDDGTIVFNMVSTGPLYRVAAIGGTPTALTTLQNEQGHRWPSWIRGGYLLYFVWSTGASGLRLVSLEAPDKPLAFYPGRYGGEYANGFLLSTRDDHWLRAQRMQLPSGTLTGDEIAIARSRSGDRLGRDAWSSSPSGVVANFGPIEQMAQFNAVSRDGRVVGTIGEPANGQSGVELAPDGRQFLTRRGENRPWLWAIDAATGAATVVTKLAGTHNLRSPDAATAAFLHQEPPPSATQFAIMTVPASGAAEAAVLLSRPTALVKPVAWTPDGKTFLFVQTGDALFDIWSMPVGDASKATPLLQNRANNPEGRLSPDGHWLAYSSDRSGALEVYVQHFPEPGPPMRVSQHGGRFRRWRADGREIYYAAGATLMSASVTPGSTPAFGTPEIRFEMKLVTDPNPIIYGTYEYDVSRDGTKFIVNRVVGESVPTLDVITNWNGRQ